MLMGVKSDMAAISIDNMKGNIETRSKKKTALKSNEKQRYCEHLKIYKMTKGR